MKQIISDVAVRARTMRITASLGEISTANIPTFSRAATKLSIVQNNSRAIIDSTVSGAWTLQSGKLITTDSADTMTGITATDKTNTINAKYMGAPNSLISFSNNLGDTEYTLSATSSSSAEWKLSPWYIHIPLYIVRAANCQVTTTGANTYISNWGGEDTFVIPSADELQHNTRAIRAFYAAIQSTGAVSATLYVRCITGGGVTDYMPITVNYSGATGPIIVSNLIAETIPTASDLFVINVFLNSGSLTVYGYTVIA